MRDQAARIGATAAARYAETVHTALIEMRGTTAPRLLLELVCARMLLPDASNDSAALLQRLDRIERMQRLTGAGVGCGPRRHGGCGHGGCGHGGCGHGGRRSGAVRPRGASGRGTTVGGRGRNPGSRGSSGADGRTARIVAITGSAAGVGFGAGLGVGG